VLEPQGTLLFLLLMVAFGALLLWLVLTKQVVFRVLAACLAFIPAMVFGIAAVNKYYDYYQSWGALFSDLSGQAPSIPQVSAAGLGTGAGSSLMTAMAGTNPALDAQYGVQFWTTVTGPSSHISRQVYIYLPPQYFSKAYANYRFPAIELLHGSPGQPATWINVMDVIPIYRQLLATRQAAPAVLVMPDTEGGLQYSLQCLNDPHGLQDMTFVGKEVPNWVAANLRVQKPGLTWGIGGYSEGGFCAANIGLQYANRFGFAGVLSGYFAPSPISQVPLGGKPNGKPRDVKVFAHYRHLAMINTPNQYILRIPVGIPVPQFFLAAGAQDVADVQAAQVFRQLLLNRVADVPLLIVRGAGHQALVWRTALSPMLAWMTTQQAQLVQRSAQVAANQRAAAQAAAARNKAHRVPETAYSPLPRPTGLSSAFFRLDCPLGRYPVVGQRSPAGSGALTDSSHTAILFPVGGNQPACWQKPAGSVLSCWQKPAGDEHREDFRWANNRLVSRAKGLAGGGRAGAGC
jgi:enterochelin esterase-like enzyme